MGNSERGSCDYSPGLKADEEHQKSEAETVNPKRYPPQSMSQRFNARIREVLWEREWERVTAYSNQRDSCLHPTSPD